MPSSSTGTPTATPPELRTAGEHPAGTERGVARIAEDAFGTVAHGALAHLPVAVRFWDGSELRTKTADGTPSIVVRDPAAISRLVRQPNELGLARAWIAGALDVEGELEPLLALRHQVRRLRLSGVDRLRLAGAALRALGPAAIKSPPIPSIEARLRGRAHSLTRDRAAIQHHYDVSNRFYGLLLGPSLSYSCAYFRSAEDSLEAAQEHKHELICQKLGLGAGQRLLDIGCGWGSLLLHAARRHGITGVGLTLSELQAELARERIRRAGLSDRLDVRVMDYRRLTDGPYDKIASIGMYEHVGIAHYGEYVRAVKRLLRPGGSFLNAGIARLLSAPPDGLTFTNRYIFPDGELHPVSALLEVLEREGLEVRHVESLREHYSLTLRRWYENITSHRREAEAELGPQRARAWQLYILGSALAFADAELSIYHVLCRHPGAQPSSTAGVAVNGRDRSP